MFGELKKVLLLIIQQNIFKVNLHLLLDISEKTVDNN